MILGVFDGELANLDAATKGKRKAKAKGHGK
jgi:hypothetical protein